MIPGYFLDYPDLILRTSFFIIFHHFDKTALGFNASRDRREKLNILWETTLKMITIHVENSSFG